MCWAVADSHVGRRLSCKAPCAAYAILMRRLCRACVQESLGLVRSCLKASRSGTGRLEDTGTQARSMTALLFSEVETSRFSRKRSRRPDGLLQLGGPGPVVCQTWAWEDFGYLLLNFAMLFVMPCFAASRQSGRSLLWCAPLGASAEDAEENVFDRQRRPGCLFDSWDRRTAGGSLRLLSSLFSAFFVRGCHRGDAHAGCHRKQLALARVLGAHEVHHEGFLHLSCSSARCYEAP